MKSLYNTLKESLLGNFKDIEASADPIKEIEQFIKANYKFWGALKISKEPNNDGKYEVSCKEAEVVNKNIASLTNNIFEWGTISGDFDCYNCKYLTTLEGAPKEVGGTFDCGDCRSLTSLEGAPKEVGKSFHCSYCRLLTSLEGAPKKVGGTFNCSYCRSLTSLEGAPKEVKKAFGCQYCTSLKTLKGCPEEVGSVFDCSYCISLTSLEGCPKKVGWDFCCYGCKQDFTTDDIEKICKVKGFIYTK